MPKFGSKNALFGYFWTRIWKHYCHIWNVHTRICLGEKFRKKTRMPKFGTKMPYLGTFGLEFEKAIVISDISTLEFLW